MAADVSARVHLVAEKLQQRAQDAQRKGNETAARALSSSVSDLRQALALLSEQRHLLARRHGESDDEDDDVEELATQLTRVQLMLSKKAEDMRAKGNETASTALQQAAETVTQGRTRVLEQQQTIFGLSERWKTLETAVINKSRDKNTEETVLDRVKHLVALEHVVLEVWPEYQILEVKDALLRRREIEKEIKTVQEREVTRREEDAALLEQQREACQAMEQLVRESDQEIQDVTRKATEEMQTLRLKLESLALENERLTRVHTEEMNELQLQLTSAMDAVEKKEELKLHFEKVIEGKEEEVRRYEEEVKDLRRQLKDLQSDLLNEAVEDESKRRFEERSVKLPADKVIEVERDTMDEGVAKCKERVQMMEEENSAMKEEVKRLRKEVATLRLEKEHLVKSHADESANLQKVFMDEIEKLQSQMESASASIAMKEKSVLDVEAVQALRDEVNDLRSKKERLEQVHVDEVEQLRQVHLMELEDLRLQLDRVTGDSRWRLTSGGNELQQLQAEIGALTIEKDRLVKEHADTIEKLCYQLDNTKAESIQEDQVEFKDEDADERSENIDVPVLELDENESSVSDMLAEEAVDPSCTGQDAVISMMMAQDDLHAQIARNEAQVQAHVAQISDLKAELQHTIKHLTHEKIEAVEELQRTHEVELRRLQASLNALQAQVVEHEARSESQECTIMSLETERLELEQQIELLTNEKAQAMTLQSTHGEETTRLTQHVVESARTIDTLSTQVEELKMALATTSEEQNVVAASLELCEAALKDSRSELAVQTRECTELKSELQAIQDTDGDAAKDLMQLKDELREVVKVLSERGEDLDVADDLKARTWQCQEAADVCRELTSVWCDLVAARDQLHLTVEQLNRIRSEGDKHKLVLVQYVNSSDWRLFAKDGDDEEIVGRRMDSDTDLDDLLTVAKANCVRWLAELQQLRDGGKLATVKIQELEQEKLRVRDQLERTEASRRELEILNESLTEQVAAWRREKEDLTVALEEAKALHESASTQEQHQQAAQRREVIELQQQLASVRRDFERYRLRSHTALKKMEKRAELLNGMRKENGALMMQVKESTVQLEQADAARRDSETRLYEVQRTLEMMQAEVEQLAVEKARVIAEQEEEIQRLIGEGEQQKAKVKQGTLTIETLLVQKQQADDESERVKEAERAAFQARLSIVIAAAQTAKQDLQKVHDALEASKAEGDKQQRRIETLEQQLKAQVLVSTGEGNHTHSVASADMKIVAGLEKELTVLRASETALRQQLDGTRAELTGLQERFATIKAANADKVFALEEQSRKWELELAAATEEVCRLTAQLESFTRPSPSTGASSTLTNEVKTDGKEQEVRQLRSELQDATTEIALLTRAFDALQEARDPLTAVASSESGKESTAVAQVSAVLHAKDDALKKLRKQALELQEELQTCREEKKALELKAEQDELNELHATRQHLRSEKERALQVQRRQTLVSSFQQQVTTIVHELQTRLEEHSRAFRSVCDFRDKYRADSCTARSVETDPEFEECLVMRSGVVIKAGANFQLPVICEQRGWRVVWNFSIKEEAADVLFQLIAKMTDATSTEVELVSPERMNDMSGVFHVQHDRTTLVFEWDNAFSWLNEKTLDYHVSIQEPLTVQMQQARRTERELRTRATRLKDGLALIQEEADRRAELTATVRKLDACEAMKEVQVTELRARKADVVKHKTQVHDEMEAWKAEFAVLLVEQDELEDVERNLTRVWDEVTSEREDVEMTLRLASNGAQIETLAQELQEEMHVVTEQLARDEVSRTREDSSS